MQHHRHPSQGRLLVAAAAILVSGCAHRGPPPEPVTSSAGTASPVFQPGPESGRLYAWDGEANEVSHIEISVDEQVARFYDGWRQVGWSTVASGVHQFPTPIGYFAVTEKVADKQSNLYGRIYDGDGRLVNADARVGRDPIPSGGRFVGADMPYFMRPTNDGIGMHGGNIPVPGSPASHGCIRLPYALAPILFRHVGVGTPVRIVGRSGENPALANENPAQRRAPG